MEYFNPNNYAELSDDSAMIQAAVDAAAKTGAAVTIPRHNERTDSDIWIITRAIRLHTGSVIYLDNCHLRQADGVYENIFTNSNFASGLWKTREGRQYDIKVCGRGNATLDGGNHNGLTEMTRKEYGLPSCHCNSMFMFVNTERVVVENLRMVNQRYWAMTYHFSSFGRISNIHFDAPETVPNQDGIDLRTGCSNFIIENITGCTGDDTVALTCLKSAYDEDMKAAQMDMSIHDVIIRNITSSTPCSLVRLTNHSEKLIYNILIENIMELAENANSLYNPNPPLNNEVSRFRTGACVRIGENCYCSDGRFAQLGETFNITVRNITGHMRMGVRLNCAVSDSTIENVKMSGAGGTAVYFGEGKMRNISVRDISYPTIHFPCPTDDNRREGNYNRMRDVEALADRHLFAVYFKGSDVDNVVFQNIFASDKLTGVFGGTGKVHMHVQNVFRHSPDTVLLKGEGLEIEN